MLNLLFFGSFILLTLSGIVRLASDLGLWLFYVQCILLVVLTVAMLIAALFAAVKTKDPIWREKGRVFALICIAGLAAEFRIALPPPEGFSLFTEIPTVASIGIYIWASISAISGLKKWWKANSATAK